MARILRIINRFNLGGPTHNAAYLTRYMAPGHSTLLVGGAPEEQEEGSAHILDALGVEAMILPEMQRAPSLAKDRAAYLRIKRLIAEYKPDVVHTHAAKAGAVGRLAAHHCGVKAIVHTFHGHVFHSYFGPLRTTVYKNVERYLARRSHAIVAISERQRQELVDEHGICTNDKVAVVPLGFDLDRFRSDTEAKRRYFRTLYGLHDDEVAVGIVGRLVPVKNHPLFLRAMAKAIAGHKGKVRVFVIGDGEERERLMGLVGELGLPSVLAPFPGPQRSSVVEPLASAGTAVVFTSWIKEVDIAYAGLDLVALSSHNEGTPVSLIEAQAAGKPVVSTRVGGVENVVAEGRTGLLVAPGDQKGMAAALTQLLADPDRRARMAGAGWAHVEQRYHYTRLVREMGSLYDRLLAG